MHLSPLCDRVLTGPFLGGIMTDMNEPFCKTCGWTEAAHQPGQQMYGCDYQEPWQPRVRFYKPPEKSTSKWDTYDPNLESFWLEIPDDEWTVAYRLLAKGSNIEVAEMRIYPTDHPGGYTVDPGEWSVEPETVPAGGLTARQLRTVRVGKHKQEAGLVLKKLRERMGADAFDAWMAQYSIPGDLIGSLRRRRKPSPDADLRRAEIAAQYVDLVQQGVRNPRVRLAKQWPLSPDTIRDELHEARRRDILTDAPRKGIAGGQLTEKGRKLLGIEPGGSEPKQEKKS